MKVLLSALQYCTEMHLKSRVYSEIQLNAITTMLYRVLPRTLFPMLGIKEILATDFLKYLSRFTNVEYLKNMPNISFAAFIRS